MKTRYTLQIAQKLQRKAILLAITALALCASSSSRAAEQCNCDASWTGAVDNNWFNPSNWSSDFIPSCGGTSCPPLAGAALGEINTGTAQISGQSQTAYACALTLGVTAQQTGNLSVNDGTLTMCGEIFVGSHGAGKVNVTNGGIVSPDIGAEIASFDGSNGSVTVDGTSSQLKVTSDGLLYVGGGVDGAGGTGLLTVTNSGTVTAVSVRVYNSGTLTGNGTVTVNSGSGKATVDGTLEPNWTLTISGDLELTSASTTQCNVIPGNSGNDAHVSGTATLDANSKLIVNMTGNFTAGTTYTLLHADTALTGTFTSVSINYPCECFTPKIQYDYVHNNVNLVLNSAACCQ